MKPIAIVVVVAALLAPVRASAAPQGQAAVQEQTGQADTKDAAKKKSGGKKSDKKSDSKTSDASGAQKAKKSKKQKDNVLAPDEPSDVETAAPTGPVHLEWKQHPRLQVGKVFRLEFEAKLQEDSHASYPFAPGLLCQGQALPETCSWQLHRNRIGVKGFVTKKIEYEVERELTEQELTDKDLLIGYTPKSQWKDVNVNVSYFKNAQIQAGKFKVPFGLDEITGVSHNDFVYRSLGANTLAPGRDWGAQVHGRFFKKGLNYWAGVFQHDGDNARSKKIQGGDQTFAVRVDGAPLRKVSVPGLDRINFGSAFALSKVSDGSDFGTPNGFRGRATLTQDTFYESVYVKGKRYRWESDADWMMGPFGARAEYTRVIDNRLGQGLGDEDLPNARAQSWYFSGTWVVTGETKVRPVKPEDDFLRHGFGAVELAARYERMWFDSVDGGAGASRSPRAQTIYPEGERALTLGLNWTLNRFTKLQFNGIRQHMEDPSRNPVPDKSWYWSQVFRVQLVL